MAQPHATSARAQRGWAAAQAARWDLARDDWAAVCVANPDDAVAHFNLGFVLARLDRHEDALGCFESACRLDPRADRAWYGLGLSLAQLSRWDEALRAFEANAQLQPISPYGWTQVARMGRRLGQEATVRSALARLAEVDAAVAQAVHAELKLALPQTGGGRR